MKFEDLTGQKFGRLTVISRDSVANNGQIRWLCQCECGKTKAILGASLKSGNTKGCGCLNSRFVEEIPGTRYGRLVVLRRGDNLRRKHGNSATQATWVCRCDCGNEIAVTGHSLRSGNTESCGCLHRDRTREKVSLPKGIAAKNRAIANMISNAVRRNITWQLSDEQVSELMQQNCHYCGIAPMHTCTARNGNYVYNGLDRVDNGKGYTIDNVVPCCIVCNNAKRTLSLPEFLEWVKRVYVCSVVGNNDR